MASPLTGAVADWVVKTGKSDHEGNFFNSVNGTYASVTRTTPKTIYDPTTGRIHDVAAGFLAVNPWGAYQAGGVGYAAVIEEARTNYLVNSYGAANTAGLWDGWSLFKTAVGTPTRSIVAGVYGQTAQRTQYTGEAGDSATLIYPVYRSSAVGAFSAGESASGSAYVKGTMTGVTATFNLDVFDGSDAHLGTVSSPAITLSSEAWQRVGMVYATLPAGASRIQSYVTVFGIHEGDTFDLTIDAVQLEKGAFATSYIPTTTAAVTRNADNVTIPTTGWSTAAGTMVAVGVKEHATDDRRLLSAATNLGHLSLGMSYGYARFEYGASADKAATLAPHVFAGTYAAGTSYLYLDGTASAASNPTLAASLTTANIGAYPGGAIQHWNAPIHRVAVYDVAKDAAAVAALNPLLSGYSVECAPKVADWIADPSGTFINSVDRSQVCTVTRTTPKTVESGGRILDVAAGKLAVRPRADGKRGWEAVIEEQRTNYLLNSSFETDSNADGASDNWAVDSGTTAGTIVRSLVEANAVHGLLAQKLAYLGVTGDTSSYFAIWQMTAVGTFAAGETAVLSFFTAGALQGASTFIATLKSRASDGSLIGTVASSPITLSEAMRSVSLVYSSLPTNTSRVRVDFKVDAVASGNNDWVAIDAVQLEKGAFATSYIPTTTATATRNADVVTVPTAGWNAANGTIAVVARRNERANTNNDYIGVYQSGTDRMMLRNGFVDNTFFYAQDSGGNVSTPVVSPVADVANSHIAVGVWSLSACRCHVLSAAGSGVSADTAGVKAFTMTPNAGVGSLPTQTNSIFNGGIHRLAVYDKALTATEVAALNRMLNGPSIPRYSVLQALNCA